LKDSWIVSGNKIISTSDLENSWSRFKEKLALSGDVEKVQEGKKIEMRKYLRLAASWILFFAMGSGLAWIISNNRRETSGKIIEVAAPLGSRSVIKMPDGSRIWLNAGSTLTYNENYGRETRSLNLSGEAYFEVTKDRSHPFIVNTTELVVRALGTRFNIKAYPDEKTISATLEEGEIDVRILREGKEGKEVILKPKEKIVYFKEIDTSETFTENRDENVIAGSDSQNRQTTLRKDVNVLTNVNTELYTSWKDPRWIIQGERLGSLTPMLERRFNLQIVFRNEELKEYKFSGTIENETVDQIMNALRLTAPLNYSISKDTISLTLNLDYKTEFGRIMTRRK
jgi:ferric-dicitrate binding protein FerR (iron transport regulator)